MAIIIHEKTGFPILDPTIPPFPASYRPDPTARRDALSSLILSVSGFRKVFAADGKEESTTSHLTQGDRELVFGMGIAFARFLQIKTGSPNPLVALGMDTRFTGPAMAEILLYGLITCGCRIRYLFILPIPELLAYVRATPSIDGFAYVSASHNPIGHNGVKLGLREGVLGGEDAASLIQQYRLLVENDREMESLLQNAAAVHPNRVEEVCSSIKKWKKDSEDAYRAFVHRMVTGTEDPNQQEQILQFLRKNIQQKGCGIVVDYNGSARTLGIDREILSELGISLVERNETPRVFAHTILPEGEALETCRQVLEEGHRIDDRFLFGYVPDCDGDRGNLVYYDSRPRAGEATEARILEAQEVFALACVSELSYHHWLARLITQLHLDPQTHPTPQAPVGPHMPRFDSSSRLAVVVNDPTSLRIEEIASRLHARVFRSEVGEANVVGLAKKLIREGWKVPFYGEGSNGGNITYPSEVRDPLATVFSILKLLYLSILPPSSSGSSPSNGSMSRDFPPSSPFQIWCEASGCSEQYSSHPDLSTVLGTLPVFTTLPVSAKEAVFPIQCTDQTILKATYEQVFWREWQSRKKDLQARWGIERWEEFNYEGLEERIGAGPSFRSGSEKGGFKILLKDSRGKGIAFLWMRKSGTEPVFRILVDMEGSDKDFFQYLLSWHHSMIQQADERCRNRIEQDAMDLLYSFTALIGMHVEDERIHRYLHLLHISEEQWISLVDPYMKKDRRKDTISPYLSLPTQGIQFLLDSSGYIKTLFLYMISHEGFDPFLEFLPESISFPRTRGELQTLLGEPIESGKLQDGFLHAEEEVWDIFRYLDVKIHAGYRLEDQRLKRLTFSRYVEGSFL